MAKDYIPRKTNEFNSFQDVMVKRVGVKAADWNIPAAEVTKLQNASAAYAVVYNKQSTKAFRTAADVRNHLVSRVKYEKQIRQFVNAYLGGNPVIPQPEKIAMGLKMRGKKRNTRSRIMEDVMLDLQPITGGRIKVQCRIANAEGRARIAPDSDGVELRYSIGTRTNDPDGPNVISHVSPVARFILQFGIPNIGKFVYVFARWRNLRHEHKSGPWCDMHMMMIA